MKKLFFICCLIQGASLQASEKTKLVIKSDSLEFPVTETEIIEAIYEELQLIINIDPKSLTPEEKNDFITKWTTIVQKVKQHDDLFKKLIGKNIFEIPPILHLAVISGNKAFVEPLLPPDNSVNMAWVRYQITPLHMLILYNKNEDEALLLVKFLIEKGASIDPIAYFPSGPATPYDLAKALNYNKIATYLLSQNANPIKSANFLIEQLTASLANLTHS